MDIREQLNNAPLDFLHAVSAGPAALTTFHGTWSKLCIDLDRTAPTSAFDKTDIEAAHVAASRIAVLADSFAYLESRSSALNSVLVDKVEGIFAQLSISDSVEPRFPPTSTSRSVSAAHSQPRDPHRLPGLPAPPSYFPRAYAWLVENLHDPYPSHSVKVSLAMSAGMSIPAVQKWFRKIREHIGWVSLCKRYFSCNRYDAVESACLVFGHTVPPSSIPVHVVSEFLAIQTRVNGLYHLEREDESDDYDESLLSPLPLSANTLPSSSPGSASPSPEPLFLTPDLPNNCPPDDSNASGSSSRSSNKRKSDELVESHANDISSRSAGKRKANELVRSDKGPSPHDIFTIGKKRQRSCPDEGTSSRQKTPPPTQTTLDASHLIRPAISPSFWPESSLRRPLAPEPQIARSSRKRRLSDADASHVPKRPRGVAPGPRMHAVSDPLPRSAAQLEDDQLFSVDHWLKAYFEAPERVQDLTLDFAANAEIQVFQSPPHEVDTSSAIFEDALRDLVPLVPSLDDAPRVPVWSTEITEADPNSSLQIPGPSMSSGLEATVPVPVTEDILSFMGSMMPGYDTTLETPLAVVPAIHQMQPTVESSGNLAALDSNWQGFLDSIWPADTSSLSPMAPTSFLDPTILDAAYGDIDAFNAQF